jgi:hypothetical protein
LFFGWYFQWQYLSVPIGLFVAGYMVHNRAILPKTLELYAVPLTLVILGIVMIDYENGARDILRDIAYYLNPIVLLSFSFIIASKIKNLGEIFAIMITLGVLFAMIHLVCVACDPSYLFAENIFEERKLSSYIVPLALALLLINRKYHFYKLEASIFWIFLFLLSLSVGLNFLRTFIVILIIFLFFGFGILRDYKKLLAKTISVFILGAILFFYIASYYQNSSKQTMMWKITKSIKEVIPQNYNDKISRWKYWRGYETYRGYLAFKNDGGLKEKIFGYGFGKKADLGLEMKLGDGIFKEISVFHNGYVNILLKTGILGLFLYLLYWLIIIINNYRFLLYGNSEQLIVGSLLVGTAFSFLFMTLVISGWLNNSSNAPFLILMGMLYSLKYRLEATKE